VKIGIENGIGRGGRPNEAAVLAGSGCGAAYRVELLYKNLTHSLPLARPSRASGFAQIPFAASQAAQVDNYTILTTDFYVKALRAHIKMRNGRVAGDLVMLQGARRENILHGSSTDEQRSSSAKDR
jgi:hypothetical protein